MRAVVGLGNPGDRYERTRHNIGFLVADALADMDRWDTRHTALVQQGQVAGQPVLLVKPQTFMNRSGEAVQALAAEVGIDHDEVLVVFDDFQLDFGRVRLRRAGSDGGHNGLASVLACLGSEQIPRLRLGVGPVPEAEQDIDFVLAPFADSEDVGGLIERAATAVRCWVEDGIEVAMNHVNGFAPLTARTDND